MGIFSLSQYLSKGLEFIIDTNPCTPGEITFVAHTENALLRK